MNIIYFTTRPRALAALYEHFRCTEELYELAPLYSVDTLWLAEYDAESFEFCDAPVDYTVIFDDDLPF